MFLENWLFCFLVPGFEKSLPWAFAALFLYHHHVTASASLWHASEASWLNSEQIKSYSISLLIILPTYFCDAQPRLEWQWTQILAGATFVNSDSSFNTLGQNWCTFSPWCGLPKQKMNNAFCPLVLLACNCSRWLSSGILQTGEGFVHLFTVLGKATFEGLT